MRRTKFMASAAAASLMFGGAALAQDDPAPRDRNAPSLQQGEDAVPAEPGDGPADADAQGEEQGFYRASDVLGSSVRGKGGEELGTVQDLLIDRESQKISHFILDEDAPAAETPVPRRDRTRDAANAEARRAADAQGSVRVVPWSVAQPRFTAQDRVVTVPLDQQRWRQAPTYTWGEIQAGPRGGWYRDVNTFYGVPGVQGRPGGRARIERDGDVEIKDGRGGEVEIKPNGRVKVDD